MHDICEHRPNSPFSLILCGGLESNLIHAEVPVVVLAEFCIFAGSIADAAVDAFQRTFVINAADKVVMSPDVGPHSSTKRKRKCEGGVSMS